MNKNVQFFTILCMASFLSQAESDRPLTLIESAGAGAIVGAAEVTFPGQPITYALNNATKGAVIKKTPFQWSYTNVKATASRSYDGFAVNAVGQATIVAMQKVIQAKGTEFFQSRQSGPLSQGQQVGISVVSGIAGSCIDTPSNAVQLFQQNAVNKGKNWFQACKELGFTGLSRGFFVNALAKEAPFAVGYQVLAPKATAIVQKYVDNKLVATAVGGATAGVFTAIVTQPGAVIRSRMQNDPFGAVYKSTWQTVQKIYQQDGMKGFYRGLIQRGGRVAIAVPLYVMYTTYLEKKMKEKSE